MDQAADTTFSSLTAEILSLCGRMRSDERQLIECLRKLDAIQPWPGEEADLAHWLAIHCEFDLVTAREKVRIARALDDLPQITAAFQAGELSYSKVRAITRIAEPESETELIDLARNASAENVVRIVRARRQGSHLNAAGAALDAWKHRYVDYHSADDGSVVFEGRLPAELGALLLQALERASDELFAQGSEGCSATNAAVQPPADVDPARQPAQARRADALALVAERYLAASPDPRVSPDPWATADTTQGCNTADRFLIIVHASAEALRHGDCGIGGVDGEAVKHDDPPRFEDGSVTAGATLRRLGCDASVVGIVEGSSGEPLNVGRKTRVIPPAIRRALKRRDGGCRFPGCTHTRFVDGHHITHWADGGETRLDNLVSLCRFHHRLLHEGNYRVTQQDDEFRFFREDDGEVLALPRKRDGDGDGDGDGRVHAKSSFAVPRPWTRPASLPRWGQPP